MNLFQKISLFIFILLLIWLVLLFRQVGLIFLGISILYYFIFIHTIKDKKQRKKIGFISLYVVFGLITLIWIISRWESIYLDRQYNKELKNETAMEEELTSTIKRINQETTNALIESNWKKNEIPEFKDRYTNEIIIGMNVNREMYPKFYHWFDTEWDYTRLKAATKVVLPIIMNWLCKYQDILDKYFDWDLSKIDQFSDTQNSFRGYYYLYNIVAQILKIQLNFINWETPLFTDPLMIWKNDPLYKYNIYMALSYEAHKRYEMIWILPNDLPIKPYNRVGTFSFSSIVIDWIWYDPLLCKNYIKESM